MCPTARVPPVVTLLTVDERLRVDAAGTGVYAAVHRHSVEELLRDLQGQRASAVLVSASCCTKHTIPRLARMVREFPRVPTVGLVSRYDAEAAQAVLLMGRFGLRTLVDVRDSNGWRELRRLLATDRRSDLQRTAMAQLRGDLINSPAGCWQFFSSLFELAHRSTTVTILASTLDVLPSTLMSRFFRARLPPPKRYLAMARLTCAAYLFENAGLSLSMVSHQLDYSSPQSFGRHVRALLGISASEFRENYDGDGMLQHFRSELVLPFLSILRAFDPIRG